MARNPRSRASKAGNRKALEMVREDMMDLPEGPEEVAALPEGLGPQTKFLGTDERGLPTVGTATPAQVSEAAATYAEKLKDKPGFEEAARVTAEGRLPGMPDLDVADRKAEKKTEEKLDVKPMNWTGYGGFEYSVDPARPGQIKINGKLFTDEQLRANTRKRGKEVGISDILLEKTDIENKGIKIAPRAKETPTARRRRIAEQALVPSTPTPLLEEFPTSDASEEFPESLAPDAPAPAPEEFPTSDASAPEPQRVSNAGAIAKNFADTAERTGLTTAADTVGGAAFGTASGVVGMQPQFATVELPGGRRKAVYTAAGKLKNWLDGVSQEEADRALAEYKAAMGI